MQRIFSINIDIHLRPLLSDQTHFHAAASVSLLPSIKTVNSPPTCYFVRIIESHISNPHENHALLHKVITLPFPRNMAPVFPIPHFIPPTASHAHTLILLHGRGSDGKEFADELFEAQTSRNLTLPHLLPTVKWVFPTSPRRYSTIFEEEMRDWFEVSSLSDPEYQQSLQVRGLSECIVHLHGLIEKEVQDVGGDPRRVVLGGISQGCAVAIHALLASRLKLGSFIGFSGWLPFRAQLQRIAAGNAGKGEREPKKELNDFYSTTFEFKDDTASPAPTLTSASRISGLEPSVLKTPVFLSHCTDDGVVDIELGRQLCGALVALGMNVTWHEDLEGGHWIKEPEGVDGLIAFLSRQLRAHERLETG